jgi:hypothetical protein
MQVPEKQHAELGASSASRWMNCPGSVTLQKEAPKGEASIHAREGTAAHALAELALQKAVPAATFIGTTVEGFEVDQEMADYVQIYVAHCISGMQLSEQYWIEKRFNLAPINPPAPMFGTGDFISLDGFRTLNIVDLKYGRGVIVEVKDNPQLMYYALGGMLAVEAEIGYGHIDEIVLTIVQPRVDHPDGIIRSFGLDYEEVLAFAVELLERAHAALQPDAPRVPGPWCRWCRAAAICPEKAQESLALATMEFGVVEQDGPPAPETLSPDELSWVMERLPLLEEWASQVRQYATHLLEKGGSLDGFKLVQKRGYRRWVDEGALHGWADMVGLEDEHLFEKKLRSVAQLEKVLKRFGESIPKELITKTSSGVTLVPADDKRPAVDPASEFTAITKGENS